MSEATAVGKKKRERSPSYPAIGLEEALNRARQLYAQERRNAAPVETILKHWGYSPGNGYAFRVLAALEKFGLSSDEGSGTNRKARLTEDAYQILIDDRPESQERLRLIQQAALRPTVHADLWGQYSTELPSEGTLRFELRKRGFTEQAAAELIDEYKATLAFAKLGEGDTLTASSGDKGEQQDGDPFMAQTDLQDPPAPPGQKPKTNGDPQARVVQIPLAPGRWAALQLPQPITEDEWTQMEAILKAMKPGLVDKTDE